MENSEKINSIFFLFSLNRESNSDKYVSLKFLSISNRYRDISVESLGARECGGRGDAGARGALRLPFSALSRAQSLSAHISVTVRDRKKFSTTKLIRIQFYVDLTNLPSSMFALHPWEKNLAQLPLFSGLIQAFDRYAL